MTIWPQGRVFGASFVLFAKCSGVMTLGVCFKLVVSLFVDSVPSSLDSSIYLLSKWNCLRYSCLFSCIIIFKAVFTMREVFCSLFLLSSQY